ncbi:DUF305 domain-containing protein [Dactylosporangium sp. CA-139114]|uniref:DUF305 domain-containing protein n=1 Tax=Dactylosporangium sp. CA-139114 TaxID=3239931 RepID=UPI003D96C683
MMQSLRSRAVPVGVAALTATVTLAGCGGTASGGDTPAAPGHGSVSVDPTFNSADAMFVRMMLPHHEQAVAMAVLAGTKATDPGVKQLAARIGTEHQAEIVAMRQLAGRAPS